MTTGKTITLTRWTFVGKLMSLLFNMLSRLVITFLPRSKHLLISWLQSPSSVILEPKKIKCDTVSTVSPTTLEAHFDPIWAMELRLFERIEENMVVTLFFRYLISSLYLVRCWDTSENKRNRDVDPQVSKAESEHARLDSFCVIHKSLERRTRIWQSKDD